MKTDTRTCVRLKIEAKYGDLRYNYEEKGG